MFMDQQFLSLIDLTLDVCVCLCVLIYQAVEELLIELDLDKKSIVLGLSRVSRVLFNSQ